MFNLKEKLVVAMFGYEIKLVVDKNKKNKLNILALNIEINDLNPEGENSTAGAEGNLEEVVTSE